MGSLIIIAIFSSIIIYFFISSFRNKGIVKLIPAAILIIIEAYLIIAPKKDSWGTVAALIYSIPVVILFVFSLAMAALIKPYRSKK